MNAILFHLTNSFQFSSYSILICLLSLQTFNCNLKKKFYTNYPSLIVVERINIYTFDNCISLPIACKEFSKKHLLTNCVTCDNKFKQYFSTSIRPLFLKNNIWKYCTCVSVSLDKKDVDIFNRRQYLRWLWLQFAKMLGNLQ